MKVWSQAFAKLGALLLVIGAGPALIGLWLFPQWDPLIPALLSLTVAPIGALCLVAGIILWLVGLARR
jgi:uncharacterized membrane protein YiaA